MCLAPNEQHFRCFNFLFEKSHLWPFFPASEIEAYQQRLMGRAPVSDAVPPPPGKESHP